MSRLRWTRVMPGEYKSEALTGWWYYIDVYGEGCPDCDHRHEGWQLSGAPSGISQPLGLFPTLKAAKAAAESHAEGDRGGC